MKAALEDAQSSSYRLFLHDHDVTLADIPAGDGFVFFVRDPIRRFVSGFYSRQRQGQPRYFYRWSNDEEEAFRLFERPGDLAEALSSPDPDRREAAEKAMHSIQHVRDPYRTWFGDNDAFQARHDDLLFVGSQEHLQDDFERLKKILGLPDDLQLPDNPKDAHRRPDHMDGTLSNEAKANLAAWYAEDYRFLRTLGERYDHLPTYDPPSPQNHPVASTS